MSAPSAVGVAPDPVTLTGSSLSTGEMPRFVPVATGSAPDVGNEADLDPAAPIGPTEPETADAEVCDLEALMAEHPAALAREAEANIVAKAMEASFDQAAPKRPAALFWRVDDPFHSPRGRERSPSGGWYQFYTEADIEELREAPEPCHFSSGSVGSPEGPGMAWRPDPRRTARKATILTTYDEWQAARTSVAEQVGMANAWVELKAASSAARRIEEAILETFPRNLAEVVAKAQWIEAQGKVDKWADYILYDVLNFAEDLVQATEVCAPMDGAVPAAAENQATRVA